MRFKLNPEQRNNALSWAFAGILVLLVYLTIQNFSIVIGLLTALYRILFPFVVGFVIAFLISPLMLRIENQLLVKIKLKKEVKRVLATLSAMIVAFGLLGLFVSIILPQVFDSVNQLLIQLPNYIVTAERFLTNLFNSLNIQDEVSAMLYEISEDILATVANLAREYLPMILNYSLQLANLIFRLLIGIIVAIYIMIDRERFALQFKKLTYALLSEKEADDVIYVTRISSKMFSNFIVGKTIDSFIVGVLCFIGMSILGWPYAILISVVIGVTNMIPVFGPFIGAVPGFFILFIVNPITAFWFLLFVLFLQQLDGNIIGPLILGDSTGLPSLWVMFAIILGGGFFGIIGMFIGVPVFAIIYIIVKSIVKKRLQDKAIEIEEK